MTQAEKLKEIANAIRAVENRTDSYSIKANAFASEIRKIDPVLTAHAETFENGYYGLRAAKCAATYLLARVMGTDQFVYHTVNIFSKGPQPHVRFGEHARIDCSTFVGLCLRGIPYEKSPYATHKGVDEKWMPAEELPSMYGTEGWEFRELDAQKAGVFHDIGIEGCSTVRYAADLGRFFYKYGRVLYDRAASGVITDHTDLGLQPGDLVFWDTSNKEEVDGRFMSISHVGIVAENTSYYYHVTGTQGLTGQIVIWYEKFSNGAETAHPTDAMVLAVRPDYRPRLPKEETPKGVNLLGYPWTYSRQASIEKNGLTISLVDMHTIKLTGTATENTTLGLKSYANSDDHITLFPGTYRLTGIEGFAGTAFALQVRDQAGDDFIKKIRYPMDSESANEFTLTEETDVTVRLYVAKNKTLNSVSVTPTLIRL